MQLTKSTVPEGRSGNWCVSRFQITKKGAELHNLRTSMRPGMANRSVTPGRYTKLVHRGDIIMSDTQAELWDHYDPIWEAEGNVLINGLGLGVVVENMLAKPEVEHITVIEKSHDVIRLVYPHLRCKRLTVIEADALTWKPPKGARYNVVWHDIWPDICSDNLDDMKRLHRRYGRRCDWQGSWVRHLCEFYLRHSDAAW